MLLFLNNSTLNLKIIIKQTIWQSQVNKKNEIIERKYVICRNILLSTTHKYKRNRST